MAITTYFDLPKDLQEIIHTKRKGPLRIYRRWSYISKRSLTLIEFDIIAIAAVVMTGRNCVTIKQIEYKPEGP